MGFTVYEFHLSAEPIISILIYAVMQTYARHNRISLNVKPCKLPIDSPKLIMLQDIRTTPITVHRLTIEVLNIIFIRYFSHIKCITNLTAKIYILNISLTSNLQETTEAICNTMHDFHQVPLFNGDFDYMVVII